MRLKTTFGNVVVKGPKVRVRAVQVILCDIIDKDGTSCTSVVASGHGAAQQRQ